MSGYSESGASLSKRNLKEWIPAHYSAKSDIEANLWLLRARASDLANTPLGRAAINASCTGAISAGLRLYPKIKADVLNVDAEYARKWARKVRNEFELWAGNVECDFQKKTRFTNYKLLLINHT